jgi:23S rRNA (cytidine1920-2'-O)/16S rRNA (cytidine1409-2'-O)-methyltransferase
MSKPHFKTPPKIRLDQYLIQKGFASSLQEAQSFCMQCLVHDKSQQLKKAGMLIEQDRVDINVKNPKGHNYVARSALKLKAAILHFEININQMICADLGCSTGGFTQVLLEYGAKFIYCVDVAYGEFSSKLRGNTKISLLEKTNVRHLSKDLIPQPLDLIVCDLSFIALTTALPASLELLKPNGILVALIKPQFELSQSKIPPGGIVRNIQDQQEACDNVSNWLSDKCDFKVIGILPSPILGAKGNQEFLLIAVKNATN